jgi:hypothetical protein
LSAQPAETLPAAISAEAAAALAQEEEDEEEVVPLPPRPSIDMFKAIFSESGSSDDDSDSDSEEARVEEKAGPSSKAGKEGVQHNEPRSSASSSPDIGPSAAEAMAEGLTAEASPPFADSQALASTSAPATERTSPPAARARPPSPPAPRLTLVNQHPLAAAVAPIVRAGEHGAVTVRVQRRTIDDDNDWVEAPAAVEERGSRRAYDGRADRDKKQKKSKKKKKHSHRHDDSDGDEGRRSERKKDRARDADHRRSEHKKKVSRLWSAARQCDARSAKYSSPFF